jgi:hypothetical protein
MALASATDKKKFPGCWNCVQKGHHSEKCPNSSLKSKKSNSKPGDVWAGAVSTVQLGSYSSEGNDEENSFDKEIDVVWGGFNHEELKIPFVGSETLLQSDSQFPWSALNV